MPWVVARCTALRARGVALDGECAVYRATANGTVPPADAKVTEHTVQQQHSRSVRPERCLSQQRPGCKSSDRPDFLGQTSARAPDVTASEKIWSSVCVRAASRSSHIRSTSGVSHPLSEPAAEEPATEAVSLAIETPRRPPMRRHSGRFDHGAMSPPLDWL